MNEPITIPRLRKPPLLTIAVFIAIIAYIASQAFAGETQRITAKPGLVELRLKESPAGADISWEAKQPLTLQIMGPYDDGAVIVFSGSSGQEVVISSDVIDWDAKKRDRTTWVVTFEGPPAPKPDDPTPKPDDPPKPPTPDGQVTAPLPDLPGFKVLLIYETGAIPPMISREHQNIKVDPMVRGWLTNNTTPEVDDRGNRWAGWRIGDPDQGVPESADTWEQMLKLPRSTLPWLVINNGTTKRGYTGPMPANSTELLSLLERLK